MAIVQKTGFDKAKRHIFKKARILVNNARPIKLAGRLSKNKILNISVPKSGTHLLELYLENMGHLRNAGKKTIVSDFGEKQILKAISNISRGQFLNAHLAYNAAFSPVISAQEISVLLLVRHPYDVAISRFNYVTHIDRTHRAHNYFRELADENDGIIKAILGVPGLMMPLQEVYETYYPWVEREDTLLCKYENLIGDDRGGSNAGRENQLQDIIAHCNLESANIDLNSLIGIIEGMNTSTLRKGVAGAWREKISDRVKDATLKPIDRICGLYNYDLIH